jgi:hypothetical protein
MSYRYSHTGLGIDFGGVLSAASNVVQDPCLHKITQQVMTLRELEKGKPKKPTKPTTPSRPSKPSGPGIGLCQAVKPLNAVIYLKKNPWVLPVAGAALTFGIFFIGWYVGRTIK